MPASPRFCFLRLEKKICITHGFPNFDSLAWEQKSVIQWFPPFLLYIEERNVHKTSFLLQIKETDRRSDEICKFLFCIEGNKTKEIMSCALSFLQYQEAKRSESLVIPIFLSRSKKKPRKPLIMYFSFFSAQETKPGHDVLCKFLSSI